MPGERDAIGQGYIDTACRKIEQQMQVAVAALTSYAPSVDETKKMLFRDEDIKIATMARDIVADSSRYGSYPVGPSCFLTFDANKAHSLTIEHDRLLIDPARVGPLLTIIAEVRAIYHQYEQVKAMLRWLNKNATLGAIRYYWPPVLDLCRDAPALVNYQHVPTRFDQPKNIGPRLQMLRDTATTVAAAAMLPDVKPRLRNGMWLTFESREVQVASDLTGEAAFMADSAIFNL